MPKSILPKLKTRANNLHNIRDIHTHPAAGREENESEINKNVALFLFIFCCQHSRNSGHIYILYLLCIRMYIIISFLWHSGQIKGMNIVLIINEYKYL